MKRCIPWTGWAVVLLIQGACGGNESLNSADSSIGAQDDSGTVDGGSAGSQGAGAATGAGGTGLTTERGGSGGVGASSGAGASSGTDASSGAGGIATDGNASTGSGGGASTGSNGAGANGTSGSGHGSPVTGVLSVPAEQACTQQSATASLRQLDMLIVQDNTTSMEEKTEAGPTKWTMVSNALTAFVGDSQSAGIGAGIVFFSGSDATACTVKTYETPAVPIAALPSNAKRITDAIAADEGSSGTPTPVALRGALNYASTWATGHPQHKVVVVLATDGLPNRYANQSGTGCLGSGANVDSTALQLTLDTAKAGVDGSPSIATYVIGVMAPSDRPSLTNLNSIAKSGGTGSAFIVSTASNSAAQFINAMNQIREANRVACDFAIPEPPSDKWIDYSQVSVLYSSAGAAATSLGWVSSSAGCTTAGGFYYDNNAAPTKVHLCPTTCSKVQADTAASIKVLFACMLPVEAGAPGEPGTPGDGGPSTGAGGSVENGGSSGAGGSNGSSGSTDPDGGLGVGERPGQVCLLNGQSCVDDTTCCTGFCNASGYCGIIIN